jgi:hypothetical protein
VTCAGQDRLGFVRATLRSIDRIPSARPLRAVFLNPRIGRVPADSAISLASVACQQKLLDVWRIREDFLCL